MAEEVFDFFEMKNLKNGLNPFLLVKSLLAMLTVCPLFITFDEATRSASTAVDISPCGTLILFGVNDTSAEAGDL